MPELVAKGPQISSIDKFGIAKKIVVAPGNLEKSISSSALENAPHGHILAPPSFKSTTSKSAFKFPTFHINAIMHMTNELEQTLLITGVCCAASAGQSRIF